MPFIAIILFGILAACFALALELLVTGLSSVSFVILETLSFKALLILLGLAFIEEASKYLFLRQYALRFFALASDRPAFRNTILLGASFGIGFAALEIVLIQYGTMTPPVLALIGTGSLHMVTSIAFALSIFSFPERRFSPFFLLSAAILFHTLYNTAVLSFL